MTEREKKLREWLKDCRDSAIACDQTYEGFVYDSIADHIERILAIPETAEEKDEH